MRVKVIITKEVPGGIEEETMTFATMSVALYYLDDCVMNSTVFKKVEILPENNLGFF